jgi:hypothetical protein
MRTLRSRGKAITLLVLLMTMSTVGRSACAGTNIWTFGTGMGEDEYSVSNLNGYRFGVTNAVNSDLLKACFVNFSNENDTKGYHGELQVFVGGEVFVFGLERGSSQIGTRIEFNEFARMIDALKKSNAPEFTVEMPEQNIKTGFSLRNAKKTLVSSYNGCWK